MIVSELITAALLVDPGAQVLISSPLNPVLNQILALGTVASTTIDGSGNFVIQMAQISTTFRITAPQNLALNEQLDLSNVIGVDTVTEPGTSNFKIDT